MRRNLVLFVIACTFLPSCQTEQQIKRANMSDETYCRSIGQNGPNLGLCMRDQQSRRQTVVADRNARLQAFANAAQAMAAADAARYRPIQQTNCIRVANNQVNCTSF